MIVTEIEIDRFRGRNPLRLLDLGNGLNVVLVGDRVDKTAMLSVVPYVLYGHEANRARNWVEALGSDASIDVQTENGVFRISRPNDDPEKILIRSPDDSVLEPSYLETLTNRIGPGTFFRIFTMNARRLRRHLDRRRRSITDEIDRMATFLRNASPQVDTDTPHPSIQHFQQLDECVEQLTSGVSSQVDLERSRLNMLGEQPNREQLTEEFTRTERELRELQAKQQLTLQDIEETQLGIRFQELHTRLAAVEKDLASIREAPAKREGQDADDAAFKKIDDRLTRCRERLAQVQEQKRAADETPEERKRFERVRRLLPRIQATLLQEDFLAAEEQSIEQLAESIRDLEARIETDRIKAEMMDSELATEAERATQSLGEIDRLASQIRQAKRQYRAARHSLSVGDTEIEPDAAARSTTATRSTSTSHPVRQRGDTREIGAAENCVKQLRERIEVDRRVEEMYDRRVEIDQELRRLYSQQLPPLPVLMFLSLPFIIGAAMILSGFYNSDPTNWQRVGLGTLVLIVTALIKLSTDNVNGKQLQATREQFADIDREIDATLEFRDRFDDGWTDTVRSWQEQLEIALQTVENLRGGTPDQTRDVGKAARTERTTKTRIKTNPSSRIDARRAGEARGRYRDAKARWRDMLRGLGLPTKLSPSQARLTIEQKIIEAQAAASVPSSALEFQLRQLRNVLDRRRHSLAEMLGQSHQLVKQLGYTQIGATCGEQMDILRETIQEHREYEQHRQEVAALWRDLCSREEKLRRYRRQLDFERHKLDVARERKLDAERARQQLHGERARLLERERDQLVSQRDELIVRDGEDATATALAELTAEQLESRLRDLQNQQITLQADIVNRVDSRARCHERRRHLDEIRKLADRESTWCDLLAITRDLSRRWRDASRQQKERTGNIPASTRMCGSYAYVQLAAENSSALADYDVDLSFDDKDALRLRGKSGKWNTLRQLPKHRLAELYISLSLACIQQFADRSVKLPVILDDILSLEPRKATNVARMLRDFAARGHQLLLITSSKKHAGIFAGLDVPIADLADRQTVAREELAESNDRAHSSSTNRHAEIRQQSLT